MQMPTQNEWTYWKYNGPKGVTDPRNKDGHLVYIRKQYYAAVNNKNSKNEIIAEKRFDCMNSWGFKDPIVDIKYNHPSIIKIYKIDPQIKLLSKIKGAKKVKQAIISVLNKQKYNDNKYCPMWN